MIAVAAHNQFLRFTGKERVLSHIVRGAPSNDLDFVVWCRAAAPTGEPHWKVANSVVRPGNYVYDEWLVQREIGRGPATTVVLPYGTQSPFHLAPPDQKVTIAYDFFWSFFEAQTPQAAMGALYRKLAIPRALHKAEVVFATSGEVRDRLSGTHRVEMLQPGVDLDVFHSAVAAPSLANPDSYILVLGGTSARKNVPAQLAAAVRLANRNDLGVICLGYMDGANSAPIKRIAHVEDSELASLYRHAALVLIAPKDEGWGLPVLEAVAAGARVVASHTPSIRWLSQQIDLRTRSVVLTTELSADALENAGTLALGLPRQSELPNQLASILDWRVAAERFWTVVREIDRQ